MIKKYGIYALVLVLLLAASLLIYNKLNPIKLSSNLVAASGNVDGDLIALNTKYAGRIENIYVEDGQALHVNDKIATLQSDEYEAQLHSLNKSIDAAKESLKSLMQEKAIAKQSIPLEILKAKKAVEIAKAQQKELRDSLFSLKDQLKQDEIDFDRNKYLFDKKLISQQNFEYSRLKLNYSKNSYSSTLQKLNQAKKNIDISLYGVTLAQAQEKKITALEAEILAARKNIEALEANRDGVQIIIDDLHINSPIEGFVVEKVANKGEVLSPGMVVATLIDPKSLYLKIFVDTMENGRLKVGDKAVVFLDAYPNRPIEAEVVRIAQNAEFTPKEVSVRSDRIQRVYAVHLKPLKVDPLLKLGIPAIGIISIDGEALPKSLSEIPTI